MPVQAPMSEFFFQDLDPPPPPPYPQCRIRVPPPPLALTSHLTQSHCFSVSLIVMPSKPKLALANGAGACRASFQLVVHTTVKKHVHVRITYHVWKEGGGGGPKSPEIFFSTSSQFFRSRQPLALFHNLIEARKIICI